LAYQILYEKLFESDAAGDQCKFAEVVREQSLLEYNELITDLQTSMVRDPRLLNHACFMQEKTCVLALTSPFNSFLPPSRLLSAKTAAVARLCPKKK
jgi:hypothetical protein